MEGIWLCSYLFLDTWKHARHYDKCWEEGSEQMSMPSTSLQSEKEHHSTHTCEIWKNWWGQSYLQGRNRDTEAENKHMDTKGEMGVRWTGRLGWTHIHYWQILCIKQIVNENLLYNTELSSVPHGDRTGKKSKKRGYMHSWFTLLYSRKENF